AQALANDPNLATTVFNQLALKADKSLTYTQTDVDTALVVKTDKTYVDTQLALKANQLTTYTQILIQHSY
ncbi:MAG: hypothetical protein ACKPKO_40625, partial [Candidatus Fonsibacter sp.]